MLNRTFGSAATGPPNARGARLVDPPDPVRWLMDQTNLSFLRSLLNDLRSVPILASGNK